MFSSLAHEHTILELIVLNSKERLHNALKQMQTCKESEDMAHLVQIVNNNLKDCEY
jgi:hypothetical protein